MRTKNINMRSILALLSIVLLISACATVGPVTVTKDDTLVTVGLAFSLAIAFLWIKSYIEYVFAKRLERFKKELEQ